MKKLEGDGLVKEILNLAWGKKAYNTKVLIMKDVVDYCDYFIILSANSPRHVRAITEFIEVELKKKNLHPLGIEGLEVGHWVLMDYGDVIVHIFLKPVREFFKLESLWSKAPFLQIEEPQWVKEEIENNEIDI